MRTYLKDCRWGRFVLLHGDMISEYVNLYGEWCEGEVNLFRLLLSPQANVVEVGANIGMHSVPLSQLCSEGRIYCYEPQRVLFQMLCANAALNQRINVHARQCAASDVSGWGELEVGDYETAWNYGAYSVEKGFSAEAAYTGRIEREPLRLVALDEDVFLQGLTELALLKIDAEGFELKVLTGARRLIEHLRPCLFIENNARESFSALVDEVRCLGYDCYWYCSSRYRPENFNRSFWKIPGTDVNMLCMPDGRKPPLDLQPVEDFEQLSGGKIRIY